MPLKTFGWACAVVVLSSPLARAQVNFDDLFGSVAFSDEAAPSLPVEPPPTPAAPVPAAPVPAAPVPAAPVPAAPIPAAPVPALPAPPEVQPLPPAELDPVERSLLQPAAPLLGEPVPPYSTDELAGDGRAAEPRGHQIDFDALLSDCDEPVHAHRHHRALGHPGDCSSCGNYAQPTPCLDQPNLPPPTTLEGYYRTPACYRDLWAGYHQERLGHCQHHHKHLHGHCDCFTQQHSRHHLGHAAAGCDQPGCSQMNYGQPGYGQPGYGQPGYGPAVEVQPVEVRPLQEAPAVGSRLRPYRPIR